MRALRRNHAGGSGLRERRESEGKEYNGSALHEVWPAGVQNRGGNKGRHRSEPAKCLRLGDHSHLSCLTRYLALPMVGLGLFDPTKSVPSLAVLMFHHRGSGKHARCPGQSWSVEEPGGECYGIIEREDDQLPNALALTLLTRPPCEGRLA